jgi:hypothetical protein
MTSPAMIVIVLDHVSARITRSGLNVAADPAHVYIMSRKVSNESAAGSVTQLGCSRFYIPGR